MAAHPSGPLPTTPRPDRTPPTRFESGLPIRNHHAAGIDVGRDSHWVCVGTTPDGSDTVREFPSHTPG